MKEYPEGVTERNMSGTLVMIARYKAMMYQHGIQAERSEHGVGIAHAGWMLNELLEAITDGHPDFDDGKVGRWLGFIQREIIFRGWCTVKSERDFSRPFFKKV